MSSFVFGRFVGSDDLVLISLDVFRGYAVIFLFMIMAILLVGEVQLELEKVRLQFGINLYNLTISGCRLSNSRITKKFVP